MKHLSFLFATFVLIVSSAPQDPPELKEAADLTESVVKLINEKKYGDALAPAKRALEIREKVLPANDPRIGNSLIYLIDIYTAKRDFGKAKEMLLRLLQHQTERFGAEHVKLAATLERLGVHHFRDGDNVEAEGSYKRALALKEKEYGADDVEVAHTLFGLGELYRALRDFEHGSATYRKALRIYAKHSGVSSPDFLRTRDRYSCLGYETDQPYNIFGEINSMWGVPPNGAIPVDSGEILNGKALSLPKPNYPEGARERGLAGRVIVRVTIDESGKVISATDMCGGPPFLSESSVAAAYKARFSPTKASGQPVMVTGVIQYNFVRAR